MKMPGQVICALLRMNKADSTRPPVLSGEGLGQRFVNDGWQADKPRVEEVLV